MAETTTPATEAPLAKLARLQTEADAAKAKATRTRKDMETLTKRAQKEDGVAAAAQKAFDDHKAEVEALLSGKKK